MRTRPKQSISVCERSSRRFGSILLVLICVLLAACQSERPQQQIIKFWTIGAEGDAVIKLLPEFERQHPGVHVDVQQIPLTAALEKLLTGVAGNATPDISQLGNTWLPELVMLHALEPLDARIAASNQVKRDDYFSGIWDTNVIDTQVYGVPWYVDTRLLFYRRDLLAQAGINTPPQNWQEWRASLIAIKALVGPQRYSILLPLNEFEPLLALAIQQDEPLLRDGDRYGNFRSAGFKRALSFYVEMFRNSWAPTMTNTQIANVWNEFGRGFYSYYISGPWNIGEFQRRLPPEQQKTWMTAPLPGPNGPGAGLAGGSSLVIFQNSKHKELAWQLIEFLSDPVIQLRFHTDTGDLPPRRSTWTDSGLSSDAYAHAFHDQLERLKPTPKVPEWESIAQQIRLVAERTVHGDLTIDQAAQLLDQHTDEILEKRRWILDREIKP
jgi:multiple sugar transport system substrate-binding protein